MSSLAFAQAVPSPATDTCTFDALTRDCQVFDARQDRFRLQDGTFIPNISEINRIQNAKSSAQKEEEEIAASLETLNKMLPLRNNIRRILRENSLDENMELGVLYAILKRPEQSDREKIVVEWPLTTRTRVEHQNLNTVRQSFFQRISRPVAESLWKDIMTMFTFETSPIPESTLIGDMNEVSEARKLQVKALVEDVKNRAIGVITKGKFNKKMTPSELAQLNPGDRAAVIKVQNINFDLSQEQWDRLRASDSCDSMFPNAYYDPRDHSISICPNFFNYPNSTLVSVIGHEIMHSFDSCNSQFPLYSFDRAKLNAISEAELASEDTYYSLAYELKSIRGNVTAHMLSLYFDPLAVDFFVRKGVLTKMGDGVPPTGYPFRDVQTCLVSKDFRQQDRDEIVRMADEVVNLRKKTLSAAYDPAEDKQRIVAAFAAHPECLAVDKHTQMGEAISDWMGGEVTGDYLKDHPGTTEYERLAPIAYFAGVSCAARERNSSMVSGERGTYGIILAALRDFSSIRDTHPHSKSRLNEIFLKNNRTRTFLRCNETSDGCTHGQTRSAPGGRGVQ